MKAPIRAFSTHKGSTGSYAVGGGAKVVKNGRFEIPAGAARKFVSVGAHYGLI